MDSRKKLAYSQMQIGAASTDYCRDLFYYIFLESIFCSYIKGLFLLLALSEQIMVR